MGTKEDNNILGNCNGKDKFQWKLILAPKWTEKDKSNIFNIIIIFNVIFLSFSNFN